MFESFGALSPFVALWCVHHLVKPSHLSLEFRHPLAGARGGSEVQPPSSMLFKVISKEIFLVVVQSIKEHEQVRFVPQN